VKYPRHLRETPGIDTTHERVMPRGEPGAWCERKVDAFPRGELVVGGHELAPRKSPHTPDALQGKWTHTME